MKIKEGQDPYPPKDWGKISPTDLSGEVIFKYKVAPVVFTMMPDALLVGTVKTWIRLKEEITSERFLQITGVQVDTDTGDIFVKAFVKAIPKDTVLIAGKQVPIEIQQAGVNGTAVIAVVGSLFAALGISLSLIAVYGPPRIQEAAQAVGKGLKDSLDRALAGFNKSLGFGFALVLVLVIVYVWKK